MSPAKALPVSSSRSVLGPYGLVGDRWEFAACGLCGLALAIVLLAELLTPSVVIESFQMPPVLVASWLMSNRRAGMVGAAATVAFLVVLAAEPQARTTMAVVGSVTLITAAGVRVYAHQLHVVLSAKGRAYQVARGRIQADTIVEKTTYPSVVLSPRELHVARLAVQGYTAAEIAHQLHIGDRTVESHLANTYAKLGIRSRGQLIRMAAQFEPTVGPPSIQ